MHAPSSLKSRALISSYWSFFSYSANQALRFGSNLLLTRLLFPEAFGLMAIAQTVLIGLTLLSDVGIRNSIVQSAIGDDESFLNTCWTLHILQGGFIYIFVLILSPFLATFYNQPELKAILAVVGLSAVIGGFTSTKYITANRKLNIKAITLVDLLTYFIGLLLTLFLAWQLRSVWALVWGGILSAALKTYATHFYLDGIKNKLQLDKSHIKIIVHTGKWILISSALTFLAGEGNKLLVAAYLYVDTLAMFTLASTMCALFWSAVMQVSGQVLYPAYAEILRNNPNSFYSTLFKSRLIMISAGWLVALFFVSFGNDLMGFLYDSRYAESGKILEILALGSLVGIIGGSYSVALFAMGELKLNTFLIFIQVVLQVAAIYFGNHYYGSDGVIYGTALLSWLLYPIQALAYASKGLWQAKLDIPFLIISILVVIYYYLEYGV